MNYLIVVIGEILGFLKKKNNGILIILVGIAWIVYAFNTANPDYVAYKEHYNNVAIHYSEPLYCLMQQVFFKAGFSFQAFLCVEAALGLGITVKAISMMSPYPNAVFGLYMIYPFVYDVVQVRSFFAQAFLLLAVAFMLKYKETRLKRYAVLFFCLLLISVGFHYSGILFSPLAILFLDEKKHKVGLSLIVPLLIISIPLYVQIAIPIASKTIGLAKTLSWIEIGSVKSVLGMVKLLAVRLMIPALIYLTYVIGGGSRWRATCDINIEQQREDSNRQYDSIRYKQNKILVLVVVYLAAFISMEMFIDGQYSRIARANLIIEYILFSRIITTVNNNSNKRILWGLMIMFSLMQLADSSMFLALSNGDLWFNYVFRAVFENSLIWNNLL